MAASGPAAATDVTVVGLFPGKAEVIIDGGRPRMLALGAKPVAGVRLVGINPDAAVLEIDGKRQTIGIGQQGFSGGGEPDGPTTINLTSNAQGHFITEGSVNGVGMRFVVDTGATFVSLGASDAVRAGIDYEKGAAATLSTANGVIRVWRVVLDTVTVGDVTLHQVDGAVTEQDQPVALLGMSFLNRMEMSRNGEIMTLKKRF